MRTMPLPLARALVKHDAERNHAQDASPRELARRNAAAALDGLLRAVPIVGQAVTIHQMSRPGHLSQSTRKEWLRDVLQPWLTLDVALVANTLKAPRIALGALAVNTTVALLSASADALQAEAWRNLAAADPAALWK